MAMRSVRDIKDPKIGMHVIVEKINGTRDAGKIASRMCDRRGVQFFTLVSGAGDDAGTFNPDCDRLSYYGNSPKLPRFCAGPDQQRTERAEYFALACRQQRDMALVVSGALFCLCGALLISLFW